MKIHLHLVFLILFLSSNSANSQQFDNTWLFGKASMTDTLFSGSVLEFSDSIPDIYYEFRGMRFDFTNASISDSLGNLLFYTNGISVWNAEHEIMENGDSLNPGEFTESYRELGLPIIQGAFILPKENSQNLFYLIHIDRNYPDAIYPDGSEARNLYYTIVDMNAND